MKKSISKVIVVIMILTLILPGATAATAAEALGMIEVRSIVYDKLVDLPGDQSKFIRFMAEGTGTMWSESFPELNGQPIQIIQIYELNILSIDTIEEIDDLLNTVINGRTAGMIRFVPPSGGRNSTQLSFKGFVKNFKVEVTENFATGLMDVQAATRYGTKIDLNLFVIFENPDTGTGKFISSLEGSGELRLSSGGWQVDFPN